MRVRRGLIRDLYVDGDRSVVMVDEQVLGLSEIATSILQAVPTGDAVSVADVTGAVIAAHGTPDPPFDVDALIRRQIMDLAAHGVLVTSEDGGGIEAATPPQGGTLTPEALVAVTQALRASMAHPGRGPWVLPGDVSEPDFLLAAQRQRVVSQLALGLDAIQMPDSLAAGLSALHAKLVAASAEVVRDLHLVLETLTNADVRVLVFKGQALASQAWGDSRARGYGDIDLLVPPADLALAYRALIDTGWTTGQTYPAPGPSWGWRHFVRTDYEMALTRGRTSVDLHWHPVPDRGAFPDFDRLWERRDEVAVDTRLVPTFSPYDALAHSASHSAKDHWRWLRGLADVHRLMADRSTWLAADRPLTGDQIATVGIAAHLFGIPDAAPEVVRDAASRTATTVPHALRGQLAPERGNALDWTPGLGTLQMMRPLWHARARPREFARRASTSALPPWALAAQASEHAAVAAPSALLLRASEVRKRLRERQ